MDIWITHGYVDIWIHRHIPRRPPGRLIGGVWGRSPPSKKGSSILHVSVVNSSNLMSITAAWAVDREFFDIDL